MNVVAKRRILCFTSYYLPGFKSGGPLRSLLHMQEWLHDEYEFMVVTRNRDLGDSQLYEGLADGRWHDVRGTRVRYLSPPQWSPIPIRKVVWDARPDLLYFHSSVDPCLTVMPLVLRRLGLFPRGVPVLVAPRGEFSAGARSIKQLKKNVYLFFARTVGLYGGVTWQATKDEEAKQIKDLWGSDVRVAVAPNLPPKITQQEPPLRQPKQTGALRLAFLSRISPMKNLHGALAILRGVRAPVTFDIYGTREDPAYWEESSRLIAQLPGNVEARYQGVVAPEDVLATLARYDAFLLPSLGENFGHVILEALLAGCPVILSDQTPWRNLSRSQVGFDIPLDRPDEFRRAIELLAAMDSGEFHSWSANARAYGLRYANNPELVQLTRGMLTKAMQ